MSTSESALGLTRRHSTTASSTRHLRFEDETETEAESRYLERQRRRVGKQGTSVLVSKPDLKLYISSRAGAGLQGAKHIVGRQQKGELWVGGADQWDSCVTLVGGVNLNLHLHPPVVEDRERTLYGPHLKWRTEPIRESYIGTVARDETNGGGSRGQLTNNNQARGITNKVQLHENQAKLVKATSTTDLPINPYAPDQLTTPIQPSYLAPPLSKCPSFSPPPPSAIMSHSIRHNGTKAGKNLMQTQEELGRPAQARFHPISVPAAQPKEQSPWMEERGLDLRVRNSSSSSSSSKTTGDNICMFGHL